MARVEQGVPLFAKTLALSVFLAIVISGLASAQYNPAGAKAPASAVPAATGGSPQTPLFYLDYTIDYFSHSGVLMGYFERKGFGFYLRGDVNFGRGTTDDYDFLTANSDHTLEGGSGTGIYTYTGQSEPGPDWDLLTGVNYPVLANVIWLTSGLGFNFSSTAFHYNHYYSPGEYWDSLWVDTAMNAAFEVEIGAMAALPGSSWNIGVSYIVGSGALFSIGI